MSILKGHIIRLKNRLEPIKEPYRTEEYKKGLKDLFEEVKDLTLPRTGSFQDEINLEGEKLKMMIYLTKLMQD
jgi:hypothetical protein